VAKEIAEPSLREVLSGVDIIGTILNTDLPRLEKELGAIRAELAQQNLAGNPGGLKTPNGSDDITVTLEEIRDLLQVQLERMDALERRVAHLATLCTPESTAHAEPQQKHS
jgi:hypothetical protein